MKRGLLQVYTGPGKGKTTAATGQIVRALGHGWQVLLVRFLKPPDPVSGEIRVLERLPGVRIIHAGIGILDGKVEPERVRQSLIQAMAAARRGWEEAPVDLLVLDEINNALHRQLLSVNELLTFLAERPEGVEVVLTGRNAPAELMAQADLVTIMACEKHPLQQGVPAREGIEY